jgi:hypothetical protein
MIFLTSRSVSWGKAKITQIGMEQGRVSRENGQVSSQFEKGQMPRGELNTLS